MQLIHPSNDELSAFISGRMPRQDAKTIETHIAECAQCCETLLTLSADDTFVELLHQAGADNETNDSDRQLPESLMAHSRYEVVEHIGRGGMGDVYKARHRVMDRIVALKVVNPRFIDNPQAVDRFRREVQAVAQLSHPNIVASHDAERADDLHFLVMEYVGGVNLAELVFERGRLPLDEACEYVCQAAKGLQFAHDQGMIHRDIKPHNLMLADDGTVKVLDLGLATLAAIPIETADATPNGSSLTAANAIVGTPDYISPEQAADPSSADARSDIYSLGATLYFLITSHAPFPDGTVTKRLKDHAETPVQRVDEICNDVPRELADFIQRMLAKNPVDRPQSANEVATALAKWTSARQAVRGKTAKRVLIGLAAAAMLLLLGIAYIATDKGTLVVKASDPGVEIIVRQGGNEIEIIDTVTGARTVRLPSGSYEVSLGSDQNSFALDKDRLSVRRSKQTIVTVQPKTEAPDASEVESLREQVGLKRGKLSSIAAINELGGSMRFTQDEPSLVTVSFNGDRYNDSHLTHVRQLDNLETLYLPNTNVTDVGIRKHVSHMTSLRNLYVPGTQVTNAGVKHIAELDELRVLYLDDLPITDAGLAPLKNLNKLVGLSLDRTPITDGGLKEHISEMQNLKMLFLKGTTITDQGLSHLHRLNQLFHLDIANTQVTDEGVQRFREAFPDCKIVR